MGITVTYPKPKNEILNKFREMFGCEENDYLRSFYVGKDLREAINKCDVEVSEDHGLDSFTKAKFHFSGNVNIYRISREKKYFITININGKERKRIYYGELLKNVLGIICSDGVRRVDFWGLTSSSDDYPLLGMGNSNGFIVIPPYIDAEIDANSFDVFVSRIERKPSITYYDVDAVNDYINKLIGIWIRELEI